MNEAKPVLVVTGGARGIGRAICLAGAHNGYRVVVNYRSDAEAASAVVARIEAHGGEAVAVQGDVADPADVERLFGIVDQQPGRLAALVNNAGITGRRGRFLDTSMDTVHQVFDVNVFGLMECCRQAVPRMQDGGGAIVNMSSGAAQTGAPGAYVWYGAAKAAVDSFSLGLARELASAGIRVNVVAPGITDTDIHLTAGGAPSQELIEKTIPMQRMARPEEIAEPVIWLLSDAASYVTGASLRVGGGR